MPTITQGAALQLIAAWERLQKDPDLIALRKLPGWETYETLMKAQFGMPSDSRCERGTKMEDV